MLYLISLLSFLLPTQIGYHFKGLPESTVYGFQIDYLIPTLYLSDIVVFIIILLGIRNLVLSKIRFNDYKLKSNDYKFKSEDYKLKYKDYKKYLIYFVLYLAFVLINIYNSVYMIPSIYKWLKITEMFLLGLIIINTKKFDVFNNFLKPLSLSVSVVSFLGIMQFLSKGSIGGLFYWLGERNFSFIDPNIAPYPYSTFSHPNSFAGFLLVFVIFFVEYKKSFNQRYFWLVLSLVTINLFLTNSLNIYVAAAIILILKFKKIKNILPLMFIDIGARFVTHRIELIKSSLSIIKDNFWTGVGLNNFIPNLPKVSNTFLNAWELQPVHNIFLLIFSETGIFGFISFVFLILSTISVNNYPLIAILVTGLNDHYWLTLQQNMLLLVFVLALSKRLQKH